MANTQAGLDVESASHYWAKRERLARFTALGVAVLILALTVAAGLAGQNGGLAGGLYLLISAAGVMLIIFPHLNQGPKHKHRAVPIAEDTRRLAKRQVTDYRHQRTLGICFGIFMCVLAIASTAMFEAAATNTSGVLFFAFVAIGVYFLIYVNVVATGFKRLTHKRARLS